MENIILSADDDITDITDFSDSEQVKVQVVNLEIKQKCWIDGEKREFMIFNGKQCYQKVEFKKGGKRKFRINLSYLNGIPKRQYKYAYNWFIFSVMMFIVALLPLFSLMSGYFIDQFMATGLAVFALVTGITAVIIGLIKSTCRVTFYSHYGRAPVLELINASPNRKSYITFIDVLQQKINSYNQPENGNLRRYLHQELDELRRLKNESVLSSTDFNKAWQRIISNSAYKV